MTYEEEQEELLLKAREAETPADRAIRIRRIVVSAIDDDAAKRGTNVDASMLVGVGMLLGFPHRS